MANIVEYENPDNKLQPSNLGVGGLEQLGHQARLFGQERARVIEQGAQGVERLGKGIEEYFQNAEDVQTHHEIAQNIISSSQMLDEGTTKLKDLQAAFPGDVAAQNHAFGEWAKDQSQTLMAQATTRKGREDAEERAAKVQATLSHQAFVTGAAAAGEHAKMAVEVLANQTQKSAHDNPGSAEEQMDIFQHGVDAMYAATPGDKAALEKEKGEAVRKQQTAIAHADILGAIDRGEDVQARIDKWSTNGWINQAQAHTAVTIAQAQATHADALQRKQELDDFHGAFQQVQQARIQPDGSFKMDQKYLLDIMRVGQLPGAKQDPGLVENAVKFYQSEVDRDKANKDDITDAAAVGQLRQKMDTGALSVNDVFAARAEHKLSAPDFNFYHAWAEAASKNPQLAVDQRDFNHWAETMKPFFTKSTALNPGADPRSDQRYGEWYLDMENEMRTRRGKGEDMKAITVDMTSRIPTYQQGLGQLNIPKLAPAKPGETPQFVPTPPLRPIEPAKTGESMDDWAKRTGR